MKYLVLLDFTGSEYPPPIGRSDILTATCHNTLNDANASINILTRSKIVTRLKRKNTYPNTEYDIMIFGKYDGIIRVVSYPGNMVFYDVTVDDASQADEVTYRYTRLDLALDFVNRATGATGVQSFGLPFGRIVSDDNSMSIELDLDIVDRQEVGASDDDYETIGAKFGMTDGELKKAYRQKIRAVHPDVGGKTEDFLRVQRAYERIKNGVPHRKRRQVKTKVIRSYVCKDPVSVLHYAISMEGPIPKRNDTAATRRAVKHAPSSNILVNIIWYLGHVILCLIVRFAFIVAIGIIGSLIRAILSH